MPLKRIAEPFIRAARQISSERDLRSLMADVAGELGFAHFALVHGPSFTSNDPSLIKIDNYPAYWSERFMEQGLFRHDRWCSPARGRDGSSAGRNLPDS